MKCNHCGRDIIESLIPPPLNYCPYCGQNLKTDTSEQAPKTKLICSKCGYELSSRTGFCPHCGVKLAQVTNPSLTQIEDRKVTSYIPKPTIDTSRQKVREDLSRQVSISPAQYRDSKATGATTKTTIDTPRRGDTFYEGQSKYSDLPPTTTPPTTSAREKWERQGGDRPSTPIYLYLLLGAGIIIFVGSLVLFVM